MFASGEQHRAPEKQFKRYTSVDPTCDMRPSMVTLPSNQQPSFTDYILVLLVTSPPNGGGSTVSA
jgi:hypothetical protein